MSNELAKDTRRHRRSGGGTLPRAALLAGVSLIALAPNAARALDGTWTGLGAEWTDGTNWSSTPDVPDDTATFTNNAAPTSVAISNDASINTIQFIAGAPAFNFTTSGTGITFDVNGASIVAIGELPKIRENVRARLDRNRTALHRFFDSRAELDAPRFPFGTIAFPKLLHGSVDQLCDVLRNKYDTTVVPGKYFEMPDHFRIGIGGDLEPLEEGLRRLGLALDDMGATI
jgi:hypothetical protein